MIIKFKDSGGLDNDDANNDQVPGDTAGGIT